MSFRNSARRRPDSQSAWPVIVDLVERAADSVLDVVSPGDFEPTADVSTDTGGLREQARRFYEALYSDKSGKSPTDGLGQKLWRFARGL